MIDIPQLILFYRPGTYSSPASEADRNFRDDPMTGKSKERIGAISKDIFSNDFFREANQVILVSPAY